MTVTRIACPATMLMFSERISALVTVRSPPYPPGSMQSSGAVSDWQKPIVVSTCESCASLPAVTLPLKTNVESFIAGGVITRLAEWFEARAVTGSVEAEDGSTMTHLPSSPVGVKQGEYGIDWDSPKMIRYPPGVCVLDKKFAILKPPLGSRAFLDAWRLTRLPSGFAISMTQSPWRLKLLPIAPELSGGDATSCSDGLLLVLPEHAAFAMTIIRTIVITNRGF